MQLTTTFACTPYATGAKLQSKVRAKAAAQRTAITTFFECLHNNMLTIICYDITDNRRRSKVARLLEGWGERVQESVFECHISATQQRQIISDIAQLIDAEQDKVRYYALCGKDRNKVNVMGQGHLTREIACPPAEVSRDRYRALTLDKTDHVRHRRRSTWPARPSAAPSL